MKISVCRSFEFDAAHWLPEYDGKCCNLHGHRWRLEVEVEGPISDQTNMVIDFGNLKEQVNKKVIDILDHQCVNDFVSYPTAERMIEYIKDKVKFWHPYKVSRLRLYETPDSFCELKNVD